MRFSLLKFFDIKFKYTFVVSKFAKPIIFAIVSEFISIGISLDIGILFSSLLFFNSLFCVLLSLFDDFDDDNDLFFSSEIRLVFFSFDFSLRSIGFLIFL